MPTRFTIPVPDDYLLARDFCSYGYFLLEPNHWDVLSRTLTTTVELDGGAVTLRVRQGSVSNNRMPDAAVSTLAPATKEIDQDHPGPGKRGTPLTIVADRALTAPERAAAKAMLVRMLRLDEDADHIAGFHAVDPRFAACGRGRVMRSATLFEDVLKTVTSCNVTWPSTVAMNRKLCRVFGKKSASGLYAFPSAAKLARARVAALRARCSVGYRDARIVQLASMWTRNTKRGGIDSSAWQSMTDDGVFDALQELPGIGPYAAANIMQLLGRYARLPLDTESVRHGKTVLGFKGSSAQIMKKVHNHFAPFGDHAFRSYWFELWDHYEKLRGKAWTWERETTGKTFTASQMKK